MLTLHGFAGSNYYNKVKIALLEKGVDFAEALVHPKNLTDADRAASPLGKVPFLTDGAGGALCESQVMLEWLEAAHPEPALLPKDPWAAAKVRELCALLDWHVEIAARQLYGQAFFGAPPLSDANAARIRKQIEAGLAALRGRASFSPYVAGDSFTMADCAAFAALPVAGLATRAVYGEDLVLAAGIDHKAHGKLLAERPSVRQVMADRKAEQDAAKRPAA